MDEDIAEAMAGRPARKPAPPPLRGFTPELSRLTDIADHLVKMLAQNGGVDPQQVEPYPRPVTAYQRAMNHRRAERKSMLRNKLKPPK